nr:MAG TPA: hypothetical protein [Caudoviricetes sp.]
MQRRFSLQIKKVAKKLPNYLRRCNKSVTFAVVKDNHEFIYIFYLTNEVQ